MQTGVRCRFFTFILKKRKKSYTVKQNINLTFLLILLTVILYHTVLKRDIKKSLNIGMINLSKHDFCCHPLFGAFPNWKEYANGCDSMSTGCHSTKNCQKVTSMYLNLFKLAIEVRRRLGYLLFLEQNNF